MIPLTEGLALLHALSGLAPDAALAELAARRTQLGTAELVWERDPLTGGHDYELLLATPAETVALSVTPAGGVPLALRAVTRWHDSEIARVDGRRIKLDDIALLLETIWGDRRLLERIVDFALIRRELERHPVALDDAELQAAIDRFRLAHGLHTVAATETWLAARSLTLAGLEDLVASELHIAQVRSRVAGPSARAAYDADPPAYDRLGFTGFPAAPGDAVRLAAEVAGGAPLFDVARRALADRGGERASRSIVFDAARRHEVTSDQPLVPGAVAVAHIRGAGPYVVAIEAVTTATWDDARDAAEATAFDAWLRERRAAAVVEWHWGYVTDPACTAR